MKRAWMLLLVMIALIAVMAVPALAAETHDHTADQVLGTGTVEITESGNYFLAADTAASVTVSGDIEVTICLNSYTWSGVGSSRPLTVTGGATVNVVDCSAQTDGVSAGSIVGVDVSANTGDNRYGGSLYIHAATVNLYNGTITGGIAKDGGNVFATDGAKLYIYGGVISNGTAKVTATTADGKTTYTLGQGGNIRMNSGTTRVYLVSGTVKDGTGEKVGGNVYVGNGIFVMGKENDTSVTDPAITGGQNTVSGQNGGSINISSSGQFQMYSGNISGGYAMNAGSNIYNNGRLTIDGGVIQDPARATNSPNIFNVNGTVIMSGGEVKGGVTICNSNANHKAALQISGTAKITASDTVNDDGVSFTSVTPATLAPKITLAGPLESGAEIQVHKRPQGVDEEENIVLDATETGWEAYRAYKQYFSGTSNTKDVIFRENGFVFTTKAATDRYNCFCSFYGGEHYRGCIEKCGGYDVKWTAHSPTTNSIGASGNYYLTGNRTTTAQFTFLKRVTTYSAADMNHTSAQYEYEAIDVALDLNGFNITNSGGRALQTWYGSSLTLCNSAVDENGNPRGGHITATGPVGKADHSQVWQMMGATNTVKDYTDSKSGVTVLTQTFEIEHAMLKGVTLEYDRSLTGANYTPTTNGLFSLGSTLTFHMYGGTLMGDADGIDKDGDDRALSSYGAGVVMDNGVFYMYEGASIVGGKTSTEGGAVYMKGANAKFYMYGGSISGGTALSKGGAVYMANGTFNLYDGTISGGTAPDGGNVYIAGGTFVAEPNPDGEAEGAERIISGGEAQTSTAHARGGNIYVHAGTLTLKDTTVSNGLASFEGQIPDKADGSKDNRYGYGGNIFLNSGATLNISDGSVITGGTVAAKNNGLFCWAPGGNIYSSGNNTITIADSEISNGQALAVEDNTSVDGKNLYVNYGSLATLSGNTKILNNAAASKQESIAVQGGTLNIGSGVEITTVDGVVGLNIRTNSSAISGRTDEHKAGQLRQNPVINMTGGLISGGNATDGGNIYLEYWAEFNMTGGKITEGKTVNVGANIYLMKADSTTYLNNYKTNIDENATLADIGAKVSISGNAEVVGGMNTSENITDKNGGSIYAGINTSITLEGNAQVYSGTSIWCGGNIYTNGTLTVGGNAKVYGGKARSENDHCNIFVVGGTLNLKDNAIVAGGIGTGGTNPTVNLSGSPTVDKAWWTPDGYKVPGYGLRLKEGVKVTVGELSGATIFVDCSGVGADALRVFTSKAADLDGAEAWLSQFHSDVEGNVIGITDDYELFMGNGPKGATVNGGDTYYELGAAAEKAAEGDLITLHSGYDQALTLKANTWLDLNGQTLTGDITTTGLRLIDSANKAYEDKGGKVTGSIGTNPVRVFTTGSQDHYTGNHRFLVLKTEDGYSAHRIYLTVKSTVLYPNKPALNYRTVFKCDNTVAEYVTAYGVKIAAEGYDPVHSNYLEKGIVLNTVEDNSYISQLNNLLTPGMSLEDQILYTETTLPTCAYITIADSFGSGNEVTSNSVNKSFKDMMEYADGQTLTAVQQASLKDLYNKYEDLMTREGAAWNLTNIAGFQSSETRGFQLRCMCNDPTSTGNPCAANGHKHFVWQPWSDFVAAPVSGNYYLTGNVNADITIPADQIVSIDLCGYSLTANAITVEKGGVLNLTNSADTGVTVAAPVTVNGNMSVYSGVSLSQEVVGSGDMNLYGGTATMAQAFDGKWYPTDEE